MDIEGATSLESLLSSPQQQLTGGECQMTTSEQMMQQPPLATTHSTRVPKKLILDRPAVTQSPNKKDPKN